MGTHVHAGVGRSATKPAVDNTDTRKRQSATAASQVIYKMMVLRNHSPTFGFCGVVGGLLG